MAIWTRTVGWVYINPSRQPLVLVKALVDVREGVEYFSYHEAKFLIGGPTRNTLREKIQRGEETIDLRLHDRGKSSARNHGTAFRVTEDTLEEL